ncbi:hypothetical protein JOC54_000451 [Alkalihalobacillus xiaoxiensis]|uniref:Uncharacterized protein n=1 Tax=Shouchella xiaoxiensis TaxID=766895 RepID=A0ABS2SNX9_9BACI|nr:hypothetical protein [Shouchella xiaoxiensis]MBM7837220.1 hypothetical protein [Shouchella xiaoxiensis]
MLRYPLLFLLILLLNLFFGLSPSIIPFVTIALSLLGIVFLLRQKTHSQPALRYTSFILLSFGLIQSIMLASYWNLSAGMDAAFLLTCA